MSTSASRLRKAGCAVAAVDFKVSVSLERAASHLVAKVLACVELRSCDERSESHED